MKKTERIKMMINLEQCAQMLLSKKSILFLCHAHPDGDTLGSAAALALALGQKGIDTAVLCDDTIADCYSFLLEGVKLEADFEPELIASIDVADTVLLGKNFQETYASEIELCIDHHASNVLYAKNVWLEGNSASTAEMIYRLLKYIDAEITKPIANALCTGVSTDTGCFRFSNTTPSTLRIAADLMEHGADYSRIVQVFFETKTKTYAALEKLALDEMQLYLDSRCAIMPVTSEMFAKSNASRSDTDRLSNLPRQIEGVLVGITMRELEEGGFKASVRTHGDVDASAICARLGGGGHRGAAGCSLKLPKQDAINALLKEVEKELESY